MNSVVNCRRAPVALQDVQLQQAMLQGSRCFRRMSKMSRVTALLPMATFSFHKGEKWVQVKTIHVLKSFLPSTSTFHLSSPAVTKLGLSLELVMLLDDYINACNYLSVFTKRWSRSCSCFLISSSKNDTILENRQGLLLSIFYEDKRVNMPPKMWIIRYQIKQQSRLL